MGIQAEQHQGFYLSYDYVVEIAGPYQENGTNFTVSVTVAKDGRIVLPKKADDDHTFKTFDEAVQGGTVLAQGLIRQIY